MALFALITGLAIIIKHTQRRRRLKTVVGRGDKGRCVCEGREERGVEGGDGREGAKRKTVIIMKMVQCYS